MAKVASKNEVYLLEVERLGEYAYDPLGFVMDQFPWGEPGTFLEKSQLPEQWQVELLSMIGAGIDPATVLQIAISSGHGIGKSAFISWIIMWATGTYVDARVIVTANTESQLATKTWPELSKWYHASRSYKDLFEYTATSLFSRLPGHEKNWRADMQPWSESRPESFAGLHNAGRRAVVLFDEASAIAEKVWETQEGAFTDRDTERLWIVCGNPTRATGRFRDCFNKLRALWHNRKIDSRTVSLTDKVKIKEWENTYGEDSDYFRVRVRGEFPRVGNVQFFPGSLILDAMRREAQCDMYDPLIMGVDVARFGDDKSVIRFRKGLDGRSHPPLKFSGLDTMQLAARVAEAAKTFRPAAIFIDETGVGAGVVDRCRQMRVKGVVGINFSSKADGIDFDGTSPRYANKRAEMYGRSREWLKTGSIDDDDGLKTDLENVSYGYNGRMEIQLEAKDDMKARGLPSPDDGDAFALTFAHPVGMLPGDDLGQDSEEDRFADADFNPFEEMV